LVLENEEALFEKVTEIPYQQLTQTQQGGQIGTTAFKNAGITLHVRPKNAGDIDRSSAQTVVTVANRQTVAIGGLRQRIDIGEFNGVPYLKDLRGVGRFFRSRDVDVRESELLVFIMPEIVSYCDEPNIRQKEAVETVECRLDNVPEPEGCPPCCRRLPYGMYDAPMYMPAGEPQFGPAPEATSIPAGEPVVAPAGEPTALPAGNDYGPELESTEDKIEDTLPLPPQNGAPAPMSATRIPSAEFQFGVAGRSDQVRALVADGRLRRLPVVTAAASQPAKSTAMVGSVTVTSLSQYPSPKAAPKAPADDNGWKTRTAESPAAAPIRR
jgi:hypothetical protein